MKRFYKTAEAGSAPGGYAVRLDGKPVKTPLHHPLLLESKALAEAIAAEWRAQGDEIAPGTMPLTQLANTMIDKAGGPDRPAMEQQLAAYGASDLVCYFAAHPVPLVKRHEEYWRPLLAWLREAHGISLEAVSGIQYHQQPAGALGKLKALLAALPPADFTVVQAAAAAAGSVVIALALLQERLTPEKAHEAACVDEAYQLETWGEDEPARKRLENLRRELEEIARFRDLVKTSS